MADILKIVKRKEQGAASHNQVLASTMPLTWVTQRLQKALAEKQKELTLRKGDLTSPYYTDDDWTKGQIIYLEEYISEINRYLEEGGDLNLPRCCKESIHICLIALRGFDSCIMLPEECGVKQ